MAGTNFSIWDPTAANQENDSTYQADSQRSGGAVNGQPFNDVLANKLLYQVTMAIRSLMLSLVSKGYSPVDGTTPQTLDTSTNTAATALATVLANLITNADLQDSGSPYSGMLVATPSAADNSNKVVNSAFLQNYVAGGSPMKRIEFGSIGSGGTTNVTFATAFGATPVVVATVIGNGTPNLVSVSSTGFSISSSDGSPLNWIAIGDA